MQDADIKILSTRLMDAGCIAQAAMHRIYIEQVPFIRVSPTDDPAVHTRIEILSSARILAVFTSINAINAVARKLDKRPAWDIACISGRTASAAATFLGREQIKVCAASGRELAAAIAMRPQELPVVFFCGDLRLDHLPDLLATHNIPVEELIVYHTTLIPVKVEETYDGIIFFSPSAADAFFLLNKAEKHTTLFAIGGTTAGHIRNYTSNPVICSRQPSQQSITERIIDYYDQKRSFA